MAKTTSIAAPAAQILSREGGATIAYHQSAGQGPGIIYLGGFRSDMTGDKAVRLESFSQARGQAFLRFDYQGHGASSGAFTDGTIGRWTQDALAALDQLTEGPQILVGSSMGGWIMLLAALARPERVHALLGIAAAPDFTERLIFARLDDDVQRRLTTDGVIEMPNAYDELPYQITMGLIEDGRDHMLLGKPIALDCPVRLLHGMKDEDVPWQTALEITERLSATDVAITLVKNGSHRLSEPADLDRLCQVLGSLLDG